MKIKRRSHARTVRPTDLIVAQLDRREQRWRGLGATVRAGGEMQTARGPASARRIVTRVEKQKALAGNEPRLRIGKIRRCHALEAFNRVRPAAAVDERRATRSVRRRKNP